MTVPARRRRCHNSFDTILPSTVRSLEPSAQHVPQPDVETQRGFAARLRTAAADAPIDAIARCRCGRSIVNDEVYGWLHVATAEPVMPGTPGSGALEVAHGPHITLAGGFQSADDAGQRCGEIVTGRVSQRRRAGEPGRIAEKSVTAGSQTGLMSGPGRPQVLQGYAIDGASQIRILRLQGNRPLYPDVAFAGRGYPHAVLLDSCGWVPAIGCTCEGAAARRWVFRRTEVQVATPPGATPRGAALLGWWPVVVW